MGDPKTEPESRIFFSTTNDYRFRISAATRSAPEYLIDPYMVGKRAHGRQNRRKKFQKKKIARNVFKESPVRIRPRRSRAARFHLPISFRVRRARHVSRARSTRLRVSGRRKLVS